MKQNWTKVAAVGAVVLMGLICGFVPRVQAAVYLKPLSAGEERSTQDGASWATAYADAATAISAAQSASDSTLYAAAGVYVIKAKITLSKNLKVYGGFAGTDGETIENRDFSSNETIFSGDVNGDDVWVHYVLDKNQIAKGGKAVTTTTTTSPIVKDGKFSAPPAYADDYDIYAPVSAKKDTVAADNTEYFVEAQKTVTELVFSGVTFTGFYSTANSQGNVINGNAMQATAKTTLEGCRFVGNASAEALVYPGASTLTARNLTFAYCFAHRSSGIYLYGAATISDCTFESIYGNYYMRPNAIYMFLGNGQKVVEGCTFTRLAKVASVNESMGGPAIVFGAQSSTGNHAIRNCMVTNCYSIATDYATGAIPIVSPNCARWRFEGCRFSKNYGASATKTDGIYTLFGTQRDTTASSVLWRDCVFDENVHVVWKTSAPTSRSYALGIAGSATGSAGSYEATFVNCVFDRNEAGEVTASGAAVTRGDVLSATANGYAMRTSVANCTFRQKGEDAGFAAVARCGTTHSTPLNVVNALVMSDGVVATPFAAPDGLAETKGICAYYVTAQNVTAAPKCVAKAEGWQSDATPFEVSAAGVLTPSVRTPGIRETADVACYDAGLADANGKVITTMPEYRFMAGTSWQGLNVTSVTAKEATLIGDITSEETARPSGAFTRGAVQVLGDAAENGKALVIRCEPLQGGGTLTGPSAQAVASGAAAQAVTAVAGSGATFSGWYGTDGALYSESAALSVSSLDADLVLVAKFSTAQVKITFDLGEGGTFTEGGASTITIMKSVGDVFPEVPAYVGAADWIVTGFSPEMPSVVPSANATYKAELLTTASRVFHVVPTGEAPAGSDGSGSSWANATDDIAAAIQDAGRYRGELWLKEGVYAVPATPWAILSNVGVYGGFAGTETARNEADPTTHVTVLTGDVGQDDYWKPNNTEPEAKDKMVFDYANRRFLPPEEEEGVYSMAAVNGTTRGYAFQASDSGIATNAVFSGLTFARLAMWALRCTSDAIGSQLTVEDCAFYACGTESQGSGCIDCYGAVTVRNCTFAQCHGGIVVEQCALGGASLVEDCTFEGCRARMHYIVSMNNTASAAMVKRCVFRRNCLSATKMTLVNFRSSPSSTLEDSRFEGNCFLRLNNQTEVVQGALTVPGAKVLRCAFIGNTNATHMAKGDYAAVFYQNANANTLVRDSYFADNAMLVTNASSAANAASVAVVISGTMTFLNCTVADNVTKAASGYASTAALYASNQNGGLAAVNSVFAGNVIEGGTGSAEFVRTMAFANNYYGMAAVNSVFYNEAEGYKPIYLKTSGQPMIIVSSYLSNVNADGGDYSFSGNFATYGVWRDVVAEGGPGLRDVKTDATTGVKAMGVTKGSALAKSGVPVYLASDGFVYIYDDVSTVSGTKPWRRVVSPQQGIYASVTGLTKDAGLVADAFGQARVVGKVAAGPLNAPMGGFVLIIR